ncbi:hypothetical protein BN1708_008136 [Verticillium longisporum]|uniref:Uncharacterized protein n=4 Tax=Verticillium longisporum TaxID=100787 RepID=A0A0G4N1H2_VERLO|nr:hypothetical protein BN1708_008136 [Verticillium longisporum]
MLARLPALFLRATSNVSTPAKEKATDHATFDASQVGTSGNPITSPRHIRPTDEREHKNGGDPRTLAESVWSPYEDRFPDFAMWITRLVSMTNFAVASSALGFQVFVLYPWHEQLQRDFEDLKKEHLRVLDAIRDMDVEVKHEASRSILQRLGWRQ